MSDPAFRRDQERGIYLPHVESLNRLVDELRSPDEWLPYVAPVLGWLPYVAPVLGGVNARVLAIFRDPGPKTRDGVGSGMLCPENDDVSAERHCALLAHAGIEVGDLTGWNSYPWYINRKPTSAEIDRGLPVLKRVIDLCPNLAVVMAHGGDAHLAWRRFRRQYPHIGKSLTTVETYHTSRQALFHPNPDVRDQREAHLRDSFEQAAAVLRQSRV